jgi:hypothetical protein
MPKDAEAMTWLRSRIEAAKAALAELPPARAALLRFSPANR